MQRRTIRAIFNAHFCTLNEIIESELKLNIFYELEHWLLEESYLAKVIRKLKVDYL